VLGARYARLDELVAELDVICLALPLWGSEALFEQKADRGDETRVWLVNTARGTIADTDAVAEALECRRSRNSPGLTGFVRSHEFDDHLCSGHR
jgi:lactate dehydrogenase-like 2-hydroxyacid dehydrogenase